MDNVADIVKKCIPEGEELKFERFVMDLNPRE
jgi:hypothetical protein